MKKNVGFVFFLSIVIALTIGGAARASGGQGDSGSQAGGGSKVQWAKGQTLHITRSNMTAELALPITPEPYTDMMVAMQTKHQNRPLDQYEQMKYIANKTNIFPVWKNLDRGKWPEFEPSLFASGSNFPDVVEVHSPALRWMYAQAGYILPLDELIFEYAPDLKHLLDIRPVERALITYPDGKLYSIPRLDDNRTNIYGFGIAADYLTALNMDVPTSYDEFLDLVKAIRIGDPDGDGTINSVVFSELFGATKLLGVFFGFMRDDWRLVDGKMRLSAATDQYKDLITEAKRWYDEDLLPKLSIDDPEAWQTVKSGMVGSVGYGRVSANEATTWFPYFKDVYGEQIHAWRGKSYYPERSWTITRDADSPEIAIKWLNYICANADGNYEWTWGVPEEDWTWRDDILYGVWGIPAPDDEWKAKQEAVMAERKKSGAQSYYDQRRAGAQFVDGQVYSFTFFPWSKANLAMAEPVAKLQYAFPMFSNEEQTYADEWQIPDGYIDSMMKGFITGAEPLANWDVYIEQLKKFGLDAWEKAHQMAYERFLTF